MNIFQSGSTMLLALAALSACGGGGGGDPPAAGTSSTSSSSGSSTSSSTSSSGSSTSSSSSSGSGTASSGGAATLTDVLTYHNDTMRSGQNLTETILTPGNVVSSSFGLRAVLAADGVVDATPLVVTNVAFGGAAHNVVYVASQNDSVYAYDADSFQLLAHASLLGAGETAVTPSACNQVTPKVGITATPVIDRHAGANGTIFVVAMSADATGKAFQRLHALDLSTLQEQTAPVVVAPSYPGTSVNGSNGMLTLDPKQYKERGALLLSGGQIYTSWASNCDINPYNSWIIAYNETTLQQSMVLNLTPNGVMGGIWSAGGVAADGSGALYALLGNGTFDANPDYGNAAVRLIATSTTLGVSDYFTPSNTVTQSSEDVDFGSGSLVLFPDLTDAAGATRQLMLAAGKSGVLYLLNRNNLGHFSSSADQVYQAIPGALPRGLYSAPAYYAGTGTVYVAGIGEPLLAYTFNNAMLPTSPSSQSAATFAFPGTSPAVSANGANNGIVWAVESNASTPAVLHAYNPANLAIEYYNSKQAANSRDAFGNGNKFVTPVIANGKVFVATGGGVAVFGLL